MKRDFRAAWRGVDRDFREFGLPPASQARIDERLLRRLAQSRPVTRRRPLLWASTALAGCACAGLILALALPRWRVPATLEGMRISSSENLRTTVGPDRTISIDRGRCELADAAWGARLHAEAPARLRREAAGLRVISGTVVVTVETRPAGADPVHVLVSHGLIQVVGTRFTVVQEENAGRVTLHEGRIRFTFADGEETLLAPGQTLAWPRPSRQEQPQRGTPEEAPPLVSPAKPVEPHDEAAPVAPGPRTSERTRVDLDVLLDRLASLREQGRFREAAAQLTHALKGHFTAATRERLSYELGAILTYQLNDAARACAHWRDHQRRHPQGRYDEEVQQALQRLGCDGEPRTGKENRQ